MIDQPDRPADEPEDRAASIDGSAPARDAGWGSPVPAGYGPLLAGRPPERAPDPPSEPAPAPEPRILSGPGTASPSASSTAAPPDRPWAGPGEANPFRRSDPRPAPTPASAPDPDPVLADGQARSGWSDRGHPDEPTRAVPMVATGSGLDGPGGDGAGMAASTLSGPGLMGTGLAGVGPGAGMAGATLTAPEAAFTALDPLPPRPMPSARPSRRPGRARSRVVLRHIDVGTVAKMSVMFYLVVVVVVVVAALLLWVAADMFGTLPSIEKSVRSLFSLRKFQLHPGPVAMFTAAAGVLIAIVGIMANIVLALIYNLIADTVGGVRVELESFSRE